MVEFDTEEKIELQTVIGSFVLKERVTYPNGGQSYFFVRDNIAIILDKDVDVVKDDNFFDYSLITNKQNLYVKEYKKVFRFLWEDQAIVNEYLADSEPEPDYTITLNSSDRSDYADASPLEMLFEKHFASVYGPGSTKFLQKEYGITDKRGITKFLDYVIQSENREIAIEENGVHYHHPQLVGKEKYRDQLLKQNACIAAGMELYRFSSDDCKFEDRFEDDIRSFIGESTTGFKESGLLVDRPYKLYDHQSDTLEQIRKSRLDGTKSFLVVFPTASGKSKIAEEDIKEYDKDHLDARYLIMVPNKDLIADWKERRQKSLSTIASRIDIVSYQYIERNYSKYESDYYSYIVIDEAHHAVAPGLKRTIQYFQPDFLIGMTATDQRPDKLKLESVFGSYRVGLSLVDAMEKGIIAKANAYRIETNIDLSEVRINGKEYVNADLEKRVRVSSRNELIVDVLKEYFTKGSAGERQGLIFCVNINHANEMARILNESGISAKAYSSKSKNPENIMAAFKNKEVRFLCTCQMISEGWNYPELGILVMARPTLSKVLYQQQLGRGLRKTSTKKNVIVIDVVDEYGAMVMPCSLHSIFGNPSYVPFGDILKRDYSVGDMIVIDGNPERVERIVEIDIESFEDEYGDYLNQEQLARELFVSTGTVVSWIKKNKVQPDTSFEFGNKRIYLFSKEAAEKIRIQMKIKQHNDETIKDDFFDFLEERDYSLSYKMPFLLSFIKNMDDFGDANILDVLRDYKSFYQNRIDSGLIVDRKSCPYDEFYLQDEKKIKESMLVNPFEKFERKRFMYYSKDLNIISLNHALFSRLNKEDYIRIKQQMNDDLVNYYDKL